MCATDCFSLGESVAKIRSCVPHLCEFSDKIAIKGVCLLFLIIKNS